MSKKVTISKEEVLHLGKLANLPLSDEEISKYEKQLSETLSYVENLSELDTKDVKPTSQTTNLQDVFFKDGAENKRLLKTEEATKNSKKNKNGLFIVDRIM
ncbi:MAG: Asp-tRNA(Asn)/Glu-tRNA(Gln) amidotransferase subunit GatC [bacterium]|nr:Asp-tRNA(Asn)/Glu-tRNA(Gln) amidotransferase subunit GatC [bacterium]